MRGATTYHLAKSSLHKEYYQGQVVEQILHMSLRVKYHLNTKVSYKVDQVSLRYQFVSF
jgi:hypothetical protein